jgi:hypothetical protein
MLEAGIYMIIIRFKTKERGDYLKGSKKLSDVEMKQGGDVVTKLVEQNLDDDK